MLIEVISYLSRRDLREELSAIEAFGYRGSFCLHGRLHPIRDLDPAKHQPLEVNSDNRNAEYVANFIFTSSQ
jgi:hypothetical protein